MMRYRVFGDVLALVKDQIGNWQRVDGGGFPRGVSQWPQSRICAIQVALGRPVA